MPHHTAYPALGASGRRPVKQYNPINCLLLGRRHAETHLRAFYPGKMPASPLAAVEAATVVKGKGEVPLVEVCLEPSPSDVITDSDVHPVSFLCLFRQARARMSCCQLLLLPTSHNQQCCQATGSLVSSQLCFADMLLLWTGPLWHLGRWEPWPMVRNLAAHFLLQAKHTQEQPLTNVRSAKGACL